MPIDDVTWTNCHKCGHRYADYVKRCPRCNSKTNRFSIKSSRPRRPLRITTGIIFVICVAIVAVSLYTIKLGVESGSFAIPAYSALAAAVAGAIAALIINRKVTKGLQRWWERG